MSWLGCVLLFLGFWLDHLWRCRLHLLLGRFWFGFLLVFWLGIGLWYLGFGFWFLYLELLSCRILWFDVLRFRFGICLSLWLLRILTLFLLWLGFLQGLQLIELLTIKSHDLFLGTMDFNLGSSGLRFVIVLCNFVKLWTITVNWIRIETLLLCLVDFQVHSSLVGHQ